MLSKIAKLLSEIGEFCGERGRIRYICSLREQIKELPPAGWRQTRLHRSLVFDYSNPYLYAKQNSRYRKVSAVLWWGRTDSNHRSDTQQIYSLSPLATRELPHIYFGSIGAGRRTRTPDLLITNQLLYQLSYTGGSTEHGYYTTMSEKVKKNFSLFRKK